VKRTQSVTLNYASNGLHSDSAEAFVYDNTNGNMTEKTAYGIVTGSPDGTFTDANVDSFRTVYSYAVDPAGFIRSAVKTEDIYAASTRVQYRNHYYDNQPLGTVTVGNETRTDEQIASAVYATTQRAYNNYGLLASETDPNGNQTAYAYDALFLYPSSVTRPLSQITQYEYDYSLGKPKTVIDSNGARTETVYDGLDRVTAVRQSDPANPGTTMLVKQMFYNDAIFPRSVRELRPLDSDANAVELFTYLDGNRRPIQTRAEAAGMDQFAVQDAVFDGYGRKVSESLPYVMSGGNYTAPTAAPNLLTAYAYDGLDRPISVSTIFGATTNQYGFWAATSTDPLGNIHAVLVDPHGRIIEARDMIGTALARTRYWYSSIWMTRLIDAANSTRNFTYDMLGRRTGAEDVHASGDAVFGFTTSSYDAASNLVGEKTPKGDIVAYAYDALNRVTSEKVNNSPNPSAAYAYDACANGVGRMCQAANANATTSYAYDVLGRVAQETRIVDGQSFVTAYAYDRQGNILSQTVNGKQTVYAYNNAGQVGSITESGQPIVSGIQYAPTGNVSAMSFANGVTAANTYDPAQRYRLTQKQTTAVGGALLQHISYGYNAIGNITSLIDASHTSSSKQVSYVYDTVSRLTQAAATLVGAGANYTQNFTYNAVGNILTSPVGSYSYQGHTIPGSYANTHAATGIAGAVIAYDANGNMTSDGVANAYQWDYKSRLTLATVTSTGSNTTFAYDTAGARVRKSTGTAITLYPNKYLEVLGSTSTRYVFLGNELVATVENTGGIADTTRYIHTDHLGSTGAVSDEIGSLVQTIDYYPYGAERFNQGTADTRRAFIGQFFDDEVQLSYLNARYYDPRTSRFVSEDPLFSAIARDTTKYGRSQNSLLSNPQELNSYSYAVGNPIGKSDPNGLFVESGFDMLMFGNSLYEYDKNSNFLNGLSVGLDGLSLAFPIVPAVGGVMLRTGNEVTGKAIGTLRALNQSNSIDAVAKANQLRTQMLDGVKNSKLWNAVSDLYREKKAGQMIIGNGSAMDALRYEFLTNEVVGGRSHLEKINQSISRFENIFKSEKLTKSEFSKANKILKEIKNVVKGGGKR
jgi:RHS repeat-associated protein